MLAQTLFDTFTQIGRLTSGLPFKPLYGSRERQSLGGYLFSQGPPIVNQVARCMNRQPEIFAEYPKSGDQLLDLQAQADGWLALKRRLEDLLGKVNDSYLSTQAEAIRSALDVAKFIEHEAALPLAVRGAGSLARQKALSPALVVIYTYRQSLLKTRARCKQKRAEVGSDPDLAKRTLEKHKKRQARLKTEKDRREARASLDAQFKTCLESRRNNPVQITGNPTDEPPRNPPAAESPRNPAAAKSSKNPPVARSPKNPPAARSPKNPPSAAPSRRRAER